MKYVLDGKEVNVRPIHYTRAMRDARKAGRKTMTRRVLRQQPLDVVPMKGDLRGKEWVGLMERDPNHGVIFKCKYGVPGDYVYLHEPIEFVEAKYMETELILRYLDDGVTRVVDVPDRVKIPALGRWKGRTIPPEWARSFDLIKDVRVERVQEISEADATAEGVETMHLDDLGQTWRDHRRGFQTLWDSINGSKPGGSWADNPWVWVVEFEVKS